MGPELLSDQGAVEKKSSLAPRESAARRLCVFFLTTSPWDFHGAYNDANQNGIRCMLVCSAPGVVVVGDWAFYGCALREVPFSSLVMGFQWEG